jgi:hemerythrin-like domain-containing protein
MNDPFELLKKDHETVETLFKEYEELEEDGSEKRGLIEKITQELMLHAEMEETICYPQFKEVLGPEEQSFLEQAYLEHQETKNTLEHLKTLEDTEIEFDEGVRALIEQVRHHIGEEEQEILPLVQQTMQPEVQRAMGDDMMTFKEARGGITP